MDAFQTWQLNTQTTANSQELRWCSHSTAQRRMSLLLLVTDRRQTDKLKQVLH